MGNSQGKPVVFTEEVNLNHFRLLRVVGKGAFGKVRIVERKDTGLTFALKYIRKDEGGFLRAQNEPFSTQRQNADLYPVIRSESVRNIIRERRMLEHLNHPFICNLRYSFQDMEYLYIVVDLMNGGDLRFHISRKTFTEEAVRFWIAELGCALRYIHKQGIIHRDVKPDNVLLDAEGHVHLADFNVASDFTPGKLLTSKSGTLAYLAPEVYGDRGYSSECDWWSLGVLFFECIYNKRPFRSHNHEKLAKEITDSNINYPVTNPPVSMPCLHAISSLLERDKRKRIGASGFSTFEDNPFFQEIDFEMLERKRIEPIFVPSSEKTNFDATYDLEELLLEEAPLEARARRQKPREQLKDDATDKEIREEELHRMIESLFEPFNYTSVACDRTPAPEDETTTALGSGAEHATTASSQSKSSTEEYHDPPTTAPGSNTRPGHGADARSPAGSPPLSRAHTGHGGIPSTTTTSATQNTNNYDDNVTPLPDLPPPPPPPSSSTKPHSSTSHHGHSSRLTKKTNNNNHNSSSASGSSAAHAPPGAGSGGGSRSTSKGGGVQVVLDSTGSWSSLADRTTTTGSDDPPGGNGGGKGRPTGMLGFLSRKRGRGSSPKPQERGVLGKEGARVVIS
ncbi:MAG: hypothetical protein M4579_005973 [Chaenotheca gracillima]|nr:MAG: hypothetical protein M4579_005973 [Chaenotheca gracillima]